MAVTNAPPLRITRDQLATFLKDHQLIKQFENLFGIVEEIAPSVLQEVTILAASALAAAISAEAQVIDVQDNNIEVNNITSIASLILNESQNIRNEFGSKIECCIQDLRNDLNSRIDMAIQSICDSLYCSPIILDAPDYLGGQSAFALAASLSAEIQALKNEIGVLKANIDPTIVSAGTNISTSSAAGGVIVSTTSTITATLVDDTTRLLSSSATLANGAGAGAGTITNAPTAGNPTKWVNILDNGTTRYIPTWT